MNHERLLQVLVSPVLTEKTSMMSGQNKYVFNVLADATKKEVKLAIEKLFDVQVVTVNVLNRKGKRKIRGNIRGVQKSVRRAYVTLIDGQSINIADQ